MLTAPADIVRLDEWLTAKGFKNSLVRVKEIPGKGRGLVVSEDVRPGDALFTLPDSALLNLRTLRVVYAALFDGSNRTGLNASQLLVLHLFLHRPVGGRSSTDPHYGAYISSLPTNFDAHPLVWCYRADDVHARALLSLLPQPIRRTVNDAWERFKEDLTAAVAFLNNTRHHELLLANTRFEGSVSRTVDDIQGCENFLWAWLCVNTRSVYYRVASSPKSPDNITLCPLLDFANHSNVVNSSSSVPTFRAPTALRAGDEVFLNYGPHPDQTLFAEYGFVTGDEERAQLDVGPELEAVFDKDPNAAAKRAQLEQAGYWGEWTMHLMPSPHPSFRVMTALRLLCLDGVSEDNLARWQRTVNGLEAVVSDANEASVRRSVERLCSDILVDAENCRYADGLFSAAADVPEWALHGQLMVSALWNERVRVATAVLNATRHGDEF